MKKSVTQRALDAIDAKIGILELAKAELQAVATERTAQKRPARTPKAPKAGRTDALTN